MSRGARKGLILIAMAACLLVGVGVGVLLSDAGEEPDGLSSAVRGVDPAGAVGAETKGSPDERKVADAGVAPGARDRDVEARRTEKIRSHRHSQVVVVAQRLSPAVVTIGLLAQERSDQGLPLRRLLYPEANETLRTFTEGPEEGSFPYAGSGVVFSPEALGSFGYENAEANPLARYVLTNYHVVNRPGDPRIIVTLSDGRRFPAELVDADAVVDIALLQIRNLQGSEIPTAPLGSSSDIMIGEPVIALGNPYGTVLEDPHPTVTVGVVSALDRSFRPEMEDAAGRPRVYRDMIQTDAAINPGNSGGPLVNYDGEVIGINTFIISPNGDGSTGVNFAIPIDRAAKVAKEILQYGQVRPIRVDMDVWTVNRYLMQRYDLTESTGLLVWRMAEDGPAAEAGLRRGDVILNVEGRPVYRPDDLLGAILARTVGERVKLTVSRGGRVWKTEYEIQQAPEDEERVAEAPQASAGNGGATAGE